MFNFRLVIQRLNTSYLPIEGKNILCFKLLFIVTDYGVLKDSATNLTKVGRVLYSPIAFCEVSCLETYLSLSLLTGKEIVLL